MKKLFKLLAVITLSVSAANIFAFDFGGLLTDDTTVKTNKNQSFKLDQKNSSSLWVKQSFDEKGMSYFVGEAVYNFERDCDAEKTTNALDSDLFKLVLSKKLNDSKGVLSAGRFFFMDLTGLAFAQNADGLLLEYKGKRIEASLYGAYTGLLNAQNVKMLSSNEDGFESDEDALYDMAEKYLVNAATVSFPNLFANQSLSFQYLGTYRVEYGEKLYNRLFFSGSLGGPVYQALYYGVSSTLGVEKYGNGGADFSNLTKANLSYYFDFCSASLSANCVYASGDNSYASAFRSFSKVTATNSLAEILYSGIFKAGMSGSIKPVQNLLIDASFDFIVDSTNTYENMTNPGFQYSAGVNWQVVSDFALSGNVSQYFDKYGEDSIDKTAFSLKAVLSF